MSSAATGFGSCSGGVDDRISGTHDGQLKAKKNRNNRERKVFSRL